MALKSDSLNNRKYYRLITVRLNLMALSVTHRHENYPSIIAVLPN